MNVKLIFCLEIINLLPSIYYTECGEGVKEKNGKIRGFSNCVKKGAKWRYDDKIGADNLIETVITVLGDQRRNISCRISIWHMWVLTIQRSGKGNYRV